MEHQDEKSSSYMPFSSTIAKETIYWRNYLKLCSKDATARSKHPEFWSALFDESSLEEDSFPTKTPRIGTKYQVDDAHLKI
jgi:hypothetical protein